jgi:glycosyltransferase involved in cell wall biosynthesis
MGSRPEVEVLLATYNGARFLREQIDSILAQDYGSIRILARDDGSTDGTVEILEQYSKRFPDRFRTMPESAPTGSPRHNFLLLMKASAADYICFCDQDDFWLPDKVSITKKSMDQLELRWGTKAPLLVFTDLQLVDDKLKLLHESFWTYMNVDPERINRLPSLMVQSVVTGCTAMLNRRLLELALRIPKQAFMHDRWIGLLASFMGKSGIVRARTVLYRQHEHNVLGTGRNMTGMDVTDRSRSLLDRIRRPAIAAANVRLWNISQQEATVFLKEYGAELPPRKRNLLQAFLRCQTSKSRFVRVATFLRYGFYYVGLKPNLAMLIYLWTLHAEQQ